jgi:hypothetical protein
MASSAQSNLENKLAEIFEKKAPQIPANGKKIIVEWAPWVSLIVGIFTLLAAWSLWHWAHVANSAINYVNSLCNAYGNYAGSSCNTIADNRLSLWVWVALVVLLVEGILYLLAFPGLRDRTRQGWKYLYYGALVNIAYAVVSLFTSYNVAGHFVGALIGSAIGFWILFQIRGMYGVAKAPQHHNAPHTSSEA